MSLAIVPRTRAAAGALSPSVGLIRVTGLLMGIALAVTLRRVAQEAFPWEGLGVGACFGLVLIGAAVALGRPFARASVGMHHLRSVALGAGAGLLLVAIAAATRAGGLPLRPVAAFLPWVGVTTLVAAAEEIALRGALFGSIRQIAGPAVALAGTSIAFALIHVPFYGWQAVPLDLGVGLVLGGLRVWTRGLAAPIAAHAVADLATWWL